MLAWKRWEGAVPDWQDASMLSAIGSIAAVLISVLALVVSQYRETAQDRREKREELRTLLVELVNVRHEFNQLAGSALDESFKSLTSSLHNTKRTIYLEAAEGVARQIPGSLTASECFVLAIENQFDADVDGMWHFARWAAERAHRASPTKQAEVLRFYASLYFREKAGRRERRRGRRQFERAIRAVAGRNDPYSRFCDVLNRQYWAQAEYGVGEFDRAATQLRLAFTEWQQLNPDVTRTWLMTPLGIANLWDQIAIARFAARDPDAGRQAFAEAEAVLRHTEATYGTNDLTRELFGLTRLYRAQQEQPFAEPGLVDGLLSEARASFEALALDYPNRARRLVELHAAMAAPVDAARPAEAAASLRRAPGAFPVFEAQREGGAPDDRAV